MTDDLASALAEAIAATGVERYRFLCSDANPLPPPNSPADWRRFLLEGRWGPAVAVDPPAEPDPAYLARLPPLGGGPCGGCPGG